MLLVLNKDDRTVMFIDDESGDVVASLTVDLNPHEAILTPDGLIAYVSNAGGNTISVIDTSTRHEIARLSDPEWRFPHGLEVTPDGRYLWMAATRSNTVYVLERDPEDPRQHEIIRRIPTQQQASHMVHFSPDVSKVYVPNIGSKSVTVIDMSTMEIVTHIEVGGGPEGVAIHPVDGTIYVANQFDNNLSIIDPETFETRYQLQLGELPVRATFTNEGNYCLLANRYSNELSVVAHDWDDATAAPQPWEIKRIPVGRWPGQIVMAPDGHRAWVTNNKHNDISEINLDTFTESRRIPAGIHPDGMIWV